MDRRAIPDLESLYSPTLPLSHSPSSLFPFADGPWSLCAHALDAVPAQYMCTPLELRYLLGYCAHLVDLGQVLQSYLMERVPASYADLLYNTVRYCIE